jgi:hypothetical protein
VQLSRFIGRGHRRLRCSRFSMTSVHLRQHVGTKCFFLLHMKTHHTHNAAWVHSAATNQRVPISISCH